jgi:RNA polymerase sigma-70 factor, ECF subfamily
VQEVFIKAMKHKHTIKKNICPKSWLISIARNIAIDEMRKKQREKDKMNKVMRMSWSDQISDPIPEEVFERNETKLELYYAIKQLKKNYRDVLILRGIKECSIRETAEILEWNEGKVRITYHRALKMLEKKTKSLQG